MEIPTQPPESRLIEELREAARPKLSVRKAAAAARMSEGRWRQIAKGYNQVSKDAYVPSVAPAETLARMAKTVGATPEQLVEAGREDAAKELLRLMTVRELNEYRRSGGRVAAEYIGLGAGLARLIPTTGPDLSWQQEEAPTAAGRSPESSRVENSLGELITAYVLGQGEPAVDRAATMLKELVRSIQTVRNYLVHDTDATVRANAITALTHAEAAASFLNEAIEEMKGARNATRTDPSTQSDAQGETDQGEKNELADDSQSPESRLRGHEGGFVGEVNGGNDNSQESG
ncbi:hypothetical protein [Mycolicibacterium llatzerense]|uniref:hypothetical protein n=1 Tax=Mycolicibacterium llatzerense TaxID=280871 RepID=UPI0021B68B8B|nr:hypothetical protein [Mycolicibacterium llatzerense]MCT7369408.1 hypothetical protein [Mycolicibacterium llatzerense]